MVSSTTVYNYTYMSETVNLDCMPFLAGFTVHMSVLLISTHKDDIILKTNNDLLLLRAFATCCARRVVWV